MGSMGLNKLTPQKSKIKRLRISGTSHSYLMSLLSSGEYKNLPEAVDGLIELRKLITRSEPIKTVTTQHDSMDELVTVTKDMKLRVEELMVTLLKVKKVDLDNFLGNLGPLSSESAGGES